VKVGREVTGEDLTLIVAVGHVGFTLRSPSCGRMLTEVEAGALVDGPEDSGLIRGTISIAGPPAHSLGELFFQDLPSAAGAIWRAAVSIPEPGMSIGVVLDHEGRSLVLEHVHRAICVTTVDTEGNVLSRRCYDPFALLDGVISACERFEQILRKQKLSTAWKALHRQYARPAFPRVDPNEGASE